MPGLGKKNKGALQGWHADNELRNEGNDILFSGVG